MGKCNESILFFRLSEVELIWKYADWLLQKDQIAGVKVRYFS